MSRELTSKLLPFLLALRGDDGQSITAYRSSDGMVQINNACKSAGMKTADYLATGKTRKFFSHLAKELGMEPVTSETALLKDLYPSLLQVTCGGKNAGTWVHPWVMTNLASYLSASFSVQIAKWVEVAKAQVVGVHAEYWTAISKIELEPSSQQVERAVRICLAAKLGGVQCHIGILGEIDLVTDDEVIEIKWVRRALHAVGQVLGHSRSFPEKGRRIHLFGDRGDFDRTNMAELRKMCTSLGIVVTEEIVTVSPSD